LEPLILRFPTGKKFQKRSALWEWKKDSFSDGEEDLKTGDEEKKKR